MIKKRSKASGVTLTETMIGVALLAVFILGVGSFTASNVAQSNQTKINANLSAVKARLLETISSDGAWIKTVQSSTSTSRLNCIGSLAGCVGLTGTHDFDLYQADGALVYSGASMGGYQLNGAPCSSPTGCPILLSLKWSPSCAASDTNCRSPLIQVSATFTSSVLPSSINLAKYSLTINRSPISVAACAAGAVPACAGSQIAVCKPSGWACTATNPPRCAGAVTWNDSSTSYGPCSATIGPPNQIHNSTQTVANTDVGKIGSADFLCIPGQPMNGFILQPGATCSASTLPVNGLCGGANGNSYANAAAATAAGLCSAGTLSAPLLGPGPWTWTCNGVSGGTTASCSAAVGTTCTGGAITTATAYPASPGCYCPASQRYWDGSACFVCAYFAPSIWDAGNLSTFCYDGGPTTYLNPGDPPAYESSTSCKDKSNGALSFCSGDQTWRCDATMGQIILTQTCDGAAQGCDMCGSSSATQAAPYTGSAADCAMKFQSQKSCQVFGGYKANCGPC